MEKYEFTLFIRGDVSDEDTIEALFAAGCDDASFGGTAAWSTADFHREAHDFGSAIGSAIAAVESVAGLEVVAIQPSDLVTMTQIADRLGRSYESVRLLVTGQRGDGNFPAPVDIPNAYGVKLWRWADILAWTGKPDERLLRESAFIAATNALLTLRSAKPYVDDVQIKGLHQLLGV